MSDNKSKRSFIADISGLAVIGSGLFAALVVAVIGFAIGGLTVTFEPHTSSHSLGLGMVGAMFLAIIVGGGVSTWIELILISITKRYSPKPLLLASSFLTSVGMFLLAHKFMDNSQLLLLGIAASAVGFAVIYGIMLWAQWAERKEP